MNIEVQTVSATRKALVVTFEASEVDAEHQALVREFAQQVRLPGFRPGKAPVAIVAKRFEKDILSELNKKVANRAYREAVEKESIKVLGVVNADTGTISVGKPATVKIEVDLQPEFELPDYKGIAVKVPPTSVDEAEVDRMIDAIRRDRADFAEVERASVSGDYVRIKYSGTSEGKAIKEIAPDRPVFGEMPQTWEEAGTPDSLIPGFGAALVGVSKGDRKTIEVTFPETFSIEALRGKPGSYEVEILEIRERRLPEMNEEFFKAQGVSSLEEFRAQVRERLAQTKEQENRSAMRQQVTLALAERISTELPEGLVEQETQNMLRQFMRENLSRGVPQEEFEKRKEELHAGARKAAVDRLKVQFALGRIAEKENIKVTNEDIGRVLTAEAMRSGVAVEKLAKDIGKDRERVAGLQRGILLDKALEFVVQQANVSVEPATAAPAA